jgi:hypothetical protein
MTSPFPSSDVNRSIRRRFSFALIALATLLLAPRPATAHPLSLGVLNVVVHPDRITVRARITTEEVQFTNSHTGKHPLPPELTGVDEAYFNQHASYLAAHLHFTVDGQPLIGRVVDVTPPADVSDLKTTSAVYNLEYPFPNPMPRAIGLTQDALSDARFSAGESWETIYDVTISQAGLSLSPVQGTLPRNGTVTMACVWGDAPAADAQSSGAGMWNLFADYCVLGVEHILGQPVPGGGWFSRSDVGFDHLLFVTALVLSTRTLWDLIKVVSAFTLAHTITLTLAALRIVNISPRITEPLISLSIVFVALQNVFWPDPKQGPFSLIGPFFSRTAHVISFGMIGQRARQSRREAVVRARSTDGGQPLPLDYFGPDDRAVKPVRWPRLLSPILAAAFFFGLFHGLGFAGGLLETMQEMKGRTVAVAIVAFSLGVEIGHQMVVLPLFALLKLARGLRPRAARERMSLAIQRIGSAAISLAGLFYLVVALKQSFSPAGAVGIVAALVVFVIAAVMLTRVFVGRRAMAEQRAIPNRVDV